MVNITLANGFPLFLMKNILDGYGQSTAADIVFYDLRPPETPEAP